MFTSPLLYHHSIPTARTVTDPRTGRRFSIVDSGVHNYYNRHPTAGNRRNTIAVVSPEHAVAEPPSSRSLSTYAEDKERDPDEPVFQLRRSSIETAPAFKKGGNMSKVVRGVKNITKGYSSVQVKVRNGELARLGEKESMDWR